MINFTETVLGINNTNKLIADEDDLELQKHLTHVKTYLKDNGVNNFFIVASMDANTKGHSVTYNNGNVVIKKLRATLEEIEIASGEDPDYDWSEK